MHLYSFLNLSLSYRSSWNEVCLSVTVQRCRNMELLIALNLVDRFLARMIWVEYSGRFGLAFLPCRSANDWYKPRNTNTGFMITSLNFWSQLLMNMKQELQRVLHDSSTVFVSKYLVCLCNLHTFQYHFQSSRSYLRAAMSVPNYPKNLYNQTQIRISIVPSRTFHLSLHSVTADILCLTVWTSFVRTCDSDSLTQSLFLL